MKKITLGIVSILLVLVFCLSGCTALLNAFVSGKPVLYVVEDSDTGAVLYLFGSIHVAPEPIDFSDQVMNAYKESEYLAVEYDAVAADEAVANMTQMELVQYYSRMMFSDGTTVKDHLSQETYEAAKTFLESNGQYFEEMDYYRPAIWSSTLSGILTEQSGYFSEYGVDTFFLNDAHQNEKKILEVESEAFQLDLLLNFDDRLYDHMIQETIHTSNLYKESMDQLYSAWAEGNKLILTLSASASGGSSLDGEKDEELTKLYEDYQNKMMTERNNGMVQKAVEYLQEGKKVFLVVGCAHMYGSSGLVSGLKAAGYKVKEL